MLADKSNVLFLTLCSNGKQENDGITDTTHYAREECILPLLDPDIASGLLAGRSRVFSLITASGRVARGGKPLSQMPYMEDVVSGPDIVGAAARVRGRYLPAAQRYSGRFYQELEQDHLATFAESPHHALIISGLYGLLTPTEPIQCYSCHVSDHQGIADAWLSGDVLTAALINYVSNHHITHIFELMADENYLKLIAWNQLRQATGAATFHANATQNSGHSQLPYFGQLFQFLSKKSAEELAKIVPGSTWEVRTRANLRDTLTFATQLPLQVWLDRAADYAARWEYEQALTTLASATPETPEERLLILLQRVELLLAAKDYGGVVRATEGMTSPQLVGLRGVALARAGQLEEADRMLLAAWRAGVEHDAVALELARRRWARDEYEQAAEIYRQFLARDAPPLSAIDHHHIATLSDYGLLLGSSIDHADRFAALATKADLLNLAEARELLKKRVDAARDDADGRRLTRTYPALLEYHCLRGNLRELGEVLDQLTIGPLAVRLLSGQQRFEILEGLEPFSDSLPGLSKRLSAEYTRIGEAELRGPLNRGRPLPAYIADLLRALIRLDPAHAHEFHSRIAVVRQELAAAGQRVPQQSIETLPPLRSRIKRLALVGGHQQMRARVIQTLRQEYHLQIDEVPPLREGNLRLGQVEDKIGHSELVLVVTGYIGHDLSGMVDNLEERGRLSGRVRKLPGQLGASGILRTIREFLATDSSEPASRQPERHPA